MLKNVCLLATNLNGAKAYLKSLVDNGLTPSRIVYVNIAKDHNYVPPTFFSRVKGKLKRLINTPSAEAIAFAKKKEAIILKKEKAFERYNPLIRGHLKKENYCDLNFKLDIKTLLENYNLSYDEIKVTSINVPELEVYLRNEVKEKYIIFSGGGILRKNMFDIGKKFIHVHPGVVPNIRGADCLLWSAIVRNEIGMSVFFMNEGIDTGEVLLTKSYSIPKLFSEVDEEYISVIPKLLINYLDPAYRADALLTVFKREPDPSKWEAILQDEKEASYYHFMHPKIAEKAVRKFFVI